MEHFGAVVPELQYLDMNTGDFLVRRNSSLCSILAYVMFIAYFIEIRCQREAQLGSQPEQANPGMTLKVTYIPTYLHRYFRGQSTIST